MGIRWYRAGIMSKPQLDVAIAILLHQDKVLVGWREAKQHQGNKHEFPGGKVEQGETPLAACRREIFEEVGVGIQDWHAFDYIQHEYDDIVVKLHLFHAVVPNELLNEIQQPWAWYTRQQLLNLNFPKANQSIVKRLVWAEKIKIIDHLESSISLLSEYLYYWRVEATEKNAELLNQLESESLAQLIVNIELYKLLNVETQAQISTIHIKQQQLMQMTAKDLIISKRYIAACHDVVSAQYAQKIGCDAVLLSPVFVTATHPDAEALGWDKFTEIAGSLDIPVFALGGMSLDVIETAQQHKAYGVAGIRFL